MLIRINPSAKSAMNYQCERRVQHAQDTRTRLLNYTQTSLIILLDHLTYLTYLTLRIVSLRPAPT